jgi:hypothetical protein
VCFSAEASFAVGAALVPAGVYCIWSAARKKPSYLGAAAAPLFFGVQQIAEGFVWRGIRSGDADLTRSASLVFLFFALAFWPFWFPVLTTMMERRPWRRVLFASLSLLATAWFWFYFYPLWTNQVALETVEHHSIVYEYDGLAIYQYVDKTVLRIAYFLCAALPPVLGSEKWGLWPGLLIAASALLAATVFHYAFVSVWCFFAAVLAIFLCVLFYRMPAPGRGDDPSLQPLTHAPPGA